MNKDKPVSQDDRTIRIRSHRDLRGPAYGITQAVVVADIVIPAAKAAFRKQDWDHVKQLTGPYLSGAIDGPAATFHEHFATRVLDLAISCLRNAGWPIFCDPRVLDYLDVGEPHFTIRAALPSLANGGQETLGALVWAVSTIWMGLGCGGDLEQATRVLAAKHEKLMEILGKKKLGGTNTLRFLEAAQLADIPVPLVSDVWCQFGWGKKQLLAQSSILSTTRTLSVGVARDKYAASQILRRGGMPASIHELADSLNNARKIADKLGYPVVVKPSALDGGVGVFAGLRNERQLADAWNEAIKHSKKILIEKHCEGEDYRLIVVDGTLRWAVGRQPAGVTGDGEHSIAELVEISNRDPRRGYHATASLRPLVLSDEALSLLDEQQCTVDSIVEAGRFIRLRRASNLSSGGVPVVVTDDVHPDNRDLVERAVNLIGLDVAGVDMIMPDIARSWREIGGTIIEINAQPQLIAASQTHLYGDILRARIGGNGRIPTVLLLTGKGGGLAERLLERMAEPRYGGVGLAAKGQAFLGGSAIGRSDLSPTQAGNALLMYRDVEALLVLVDDDSLLKSGLPFDRFDMLAIAGTSLGDDILDQVIDLVADHCAGDVAITDAALAEKLSGHRKLKDRTLQLLDVESMVTRLLAHAISGSADGALQ